MSRVVLCARACAGELPLIAGALRDRGAEPIALDPTAFPGSVPVTLDYDRDPSRELRGVFRALWGGDALDSARGVSAAWHSLVVGTGLPEMAPGVRETCVAAAERAVVGLLDSLDVFQLDPHAAKLAADNKPRQLRVAQRVGLDIPRTLISNDPEAVRAFARQCGPVITKMLVQPVAAGPAADGEADVVFTTAMTAAELDQLDGLELCPMIFQEQIDNQLDVRVTVVGRRVFGAAIDRAARGGDPDWRRHGYAHDVAPGWAPHELPRAVADRLLALMDELALNYGAADFIVRPDGQYVFLELNASGSFAFLGADHAGPIAAAIAEVLVDPAARRVAGR